LLILHDSTELDYSSKKSLDGLGQIGNGRGRGYIAYHGLAVDPRRRETLGLVGQILHRRRKVRKNEGVAARRDRSDRESRLWKSGTQHLPADRRLIDVCDRGADVFEFLEHEVQSGRRFVIRSSYNRSCIPGHDPDATSNKTTLHTWARTLEPLGETNVKVQAKSPRRKSKRKNGKLKHPARSARTARLYVTGASVSLRAPHVRRGDHSRKPLPIWIVRVSEPNPPAGEEPLEWLLLTNEPITTLEDALRVLEWYRLRWIVEEYHKAQKTGCNIEEFQFRSCERLEPAIALISVIALTLLRLRDAARAPDAETREAREIIGEEYIEALSLWRHKEVRTNWTVHEFVLALGRLGGHQNRRGDGIPGWITLWRGWSSLTIRVQTLQLLKRKRKRCA
jgi:hypothetical protein